MKFPLFTRLANWVSNFYVWAKTAVLAIAAAVVAITAVVVAITAALDLWDNYHDQGQVPTINIVSHMSNNTHAMMSLEQILGKYSGLKPGTYPTQIK